MCLGKCMLSCCHVVMGRWQSGQLQRTVNPPPKGYEGSNPSLPSSKQQNTKRKVQKIIAFYFEALEIWNFVSWGRSLVGRAPRLHRGGQGFDSPRLHQFIMLRWSFREKNCLFQTWSVLVFAPFKVHRQRGVVEWLLFASTIYGCSYLFFASMGKNVGRFSLTPTLSQPLTSFTRRGRFGYLHFVALIICHMLP